MTVFIVKCGVTGRIIGVKYYENSAIGLRKICLRLGTQAIIEEHEVEDYADY